MDTKQGTSHGACGVVGTELENTLRTGPKSKIMSNVCAAVRGLCRAGEQRRSRTSPGPEGGPKPLGRRSRGRGIGTQRQVLSPPLGLVCGCVGVWVCGCVGVGAWVRGCVGERERENNK